MTDEQRHDLAAIAAAIAAAGENPSPFLLAERERLTREIERQEAREELAAAGGIPTAKIGDVVPGLPQDTQAPGEVAEHPYAQLWRQVKGATARGGLAMGRAAAETALGGGLAAVNPVSQTAEMLGVHNPLKEAGSDVAKWVGDKLMRGEGRGQALADAWKRTEDQKDEELATDLAASPTGLNVAKLGAIEVLAPSVPMGFGVSRAQRAASAADPAIRESVEIARSLGRQSMQRKAVATEAADQAIAAMDAAIGSTWDKIKGEMAVLRAKGGLAASDKTALEQAVNAAYRGDSAGLEAAAKALPGKFDELLAHVENVRQIVAKHQDEWAAATHPDPEEMEKFLHKNGNRGQFAISAETDATFHRNVNQNSKEWEAAKAQLTRVYGSEQKAADILADSIRAGAKTPLGRDVEHAATSLNKQSLLDMSRDHIRQWVQGNKVDPKISDRASYTAKVLNELIASGADDKLIEAAQQKNDLAQLALEQAQAQAEKVTNQIRGFVGDTRMQNKINQPIKKLLDPGSSVSRDRRLAESLLERLPEEVRLKLDWHRSEVVLDALGAARHPAQTAQTTVATFVTQAENARLGKDLASNLAGRGLTFAEEHPPNYVKIDHDWPALKGAYVHPDLFPVLAHNLHGDVFEHASPALAAAAKAAAAAGKVAQMGPINAVIKAKLVATNTGTLFMNAATSTFNSLFMNPQAAVSKLGRDAVKSGLRSMGREMRLALGVKLPYGEAATVASDVLKAHGANTTDAFELLFRQHTPTSAFNPSIGKQAQRMMLPAAGRQIKPVAKVAFDYIINPATKLFKAGGVILQYGDEIPRRITFASELGNQALIHGMPKTAEEAAQQAARAGEATRKITPTVDEMNVGVQQALRDAPLGAFATYPVDTSTRVWYGQLKQAISEIDDGIAGKVPNPKASVMVGMRRIAGLTGLFTMGGMAYAGAKLLGAKQDKAKNEAIARESGSPGDTMMTLPSDYPEVRAINVSRAMPQGPLTSLMAAIGEKLEGKQPANMDEILLDFAGHMTSLVSGEQPAAKTARQALGGRDQYGREIWAPGDSTAEATGKGALYAAKEFAKPVGAARVLADAIIPGYKSKVSSPGLIPSERIMNIERLLSVKLGAAKDDLYSQSSQDRAAGDITSRPEYNESMKKAWLMIQNYRAMGVPEQRIQQMIQMEFRSQAERQMAMALLSQAPPSAAPPLPVRQPDPRSPW